MNSIWSRTRSKTIKKSFKNRSWKAITLDKSFWRFIGKFIIYQIYKKVYAEIAIEAKTWSHLKSSMSPENVTKPFLNKLADPLSLELLNL